MELRIDFDLTVQRRSGSLDNYYLGIGLQTVLENIIDSGALLY